MKHWEKQKRNKKGYFLRGNKPPMKPMRVDESERNFILQSRKNPRLKAIISDEKVQ